MKKIKLLILFFYLSNPNIFSQKIIVEEISNNKYFISLVESEIDTTRLIEFPFKIEVYDYNIEYETIYIVYEGNYSHISRAKFEKEDSIWYGKENKFFYVFPSSIDEFGIVRDPVPFNRSLELRVDKEGEIYKLQDGNIKLFNGSFEENN